MKVGDYVVFWGDRKGKITKYCGFNEAFKRKVYQVKVGRGKYVHLAENVLKVFEVPIEQIQKQKATTVRIKKLKKQLKKEESKLLSWI